MPHVILLGDSIFDNARYVPGESPVVKQVEMALPAGSKSTLLAIDGSITAEVLPQLQKLPRDATHLVISTGGNDALDCAGLLRTECSIVAEALALLNEQVDSFREDYQEMLKAALATGKPVAVCTIYDQVPGLGRPEMTGLDLFNAVILRMASLASVPVIDLRVICDQATDYSPLSPIEPSFAGGVKIARTIAHVIARHPFDRPCCTLYGK